MRKFYIFCTFILSLQIQAQVGIGTTSPNAQLEIVSSNQATPANTDGLLIPKINAFPATNPTASQQGMLVYLTTTVGVNAPGFYFWDNPTTSWKSIGATTGWSLLGNAGTTPATKFLGTTDDNDFVIKRNSIRAGFIGNPNTTTGNMNTSFGANSLLNPSGTRNTAIGTNVMPSISTGILNVAVGDQSMFSNTSGSTNSAMGVGALYSNTNGSSNVAIGRNALTTANASNNTAVGFGSLRQNATGTNNTALGYQSGYTAIGSNSVFIGYNAGYNETTSGKLYIENATLTTDSSPNNALIYGEFTSSPKVVRTNAQLQIGNPTVSGYSLPTVRGNAGQLLQTDGAGSTSWVDTASNISIVRTNLSADQSLGTGGWQKLNFNTVAFDTKSEFNTGTNRFTAIKAGYYEINAGFHTFNQSDTNYYAIAVYKNGSEYQETASHHFGSNLISRTINCIVYLNASDYIEIYAHNITSGTTIDSYSGKTYFEVKQIK